MGLKRDIKDSGVDNIDPWEDMEEDLNFIQSYLLPKISLETVEHTLLKIKTKYILRLLCESKEDMKSFMLKNNGLLSELVSSGWSPFSLRGIPFKCGQIASNNVWKNLRTVELELPKSEKIEGKVFSFK
jgi:hypothetical protein